MSVELWDTSSEDADININRILRSLVIPDEEMVPVLPKARNFSLTEFYSENKKMFSSCLRKYIQFLFPTH